MSDNPAVTKKSFSLDWLISGVLTKFGDIFDSLTGRRWKPSSSLATSELTEKLKKLLDQEVKDLGGKGKFVPHNLKLKMQWDKFSTDSEKALNTLKTELLIAAIDHINDHRYQTYETLNLEIKNDYFTDGVKLTASFDKIGKEASEAAVNVTVPEIKVGDFAPEPLIENEPQKEIFIAEFSLNGKSRQIQLKFSPGMRRSVGRNRQNDLTIDDNSVSKIHAVLVLNKENQFQIADTGSTNGTFINEERISYGKAVTISDTDKIKFGTIDVSFTRQIAPEISNPDGNVDIASKTEVLQDSKPLIPPPDFPETEKNLQTKVAQTDLAKESDREIDLHKNVIEPKNTEVTQQGVIFDFDQHTSDNQK